MRSYDTTFAQRLGRVIAVPSYHYHPVFAQALRTAFATYKPTAIALEVSDLWAEEFEWGVSCWPCPMVSFANHTFAPVLVLNSATAEALEVTHPRFFGF